MKDIIFDIKPYDEVYPLHSAEGEVVESVRVEDDREPDFVFSATVPDKEAIIAQDPQEALTQIGSRRWSNGIARGMQALVGVGTTWGGANLIDRNLQGEQNFGLLVALAGLGVTFSAFNEWRKKENMLNGLSDYIVREMSAGFKEKIASMKSTPPES